MSLNLSYIKSYVTKCYVSLKDTCYQKLSENKCYISSKVRCQ